MIGYFKGLFDRVELVMQNHFDETGFFPDRVVLDKVGMNLVYNIKIEKREAKE